MNKEEALQKYGAGIHIGDGVYAFYDGSALVLVASCLDPTKHYTSLDTDVIYLDRNLRKAVRRIIDQLDGNK